MKIVMICAVLLLSQNGLAQSSHAGVMPLRVPISCTTIVNACRAANIKNGVKTKMDPFVDCIDLITSGKKLKDVKAPTAKMLKNCKAAVQRKRDAINHKGKK